MTGYVTTQSHRQAQDDNMHWIAVTLLSSLIAMLRDATPGREVELLKRFDVDRWMTDAKRNANLAKPSEITETADVFHAGSQKFYRALLIHEISVEEAMYVPNEATSDTDLDITRVQTATEPSVGLYSVGIHGLARDLFIQGIMDKERRGTPLDTASWAFGCAVDFHRMARAQQDAHQQLAQLKAKYGNTNASGA